MSRISLYFTFASDTSFGVQKLDFTCKQEHEQIQGLIPGRAYQLFFQGLVFLTQLPQPDALPSCGQSSALSKGDIQIFSDGIF